MHFRKKLIAIVMVLVFFVFEFYIGYLATNQSEALAQALHAPKQTLHVWYADEALTDYMNSVSLKFYEDNGIRVIPELVSGLEYLENINKASLHSDEIPDLYITSNDSLEKAYLAGLASEIQDNSNLCQEKNYPKTALNAVSYKGKLIGYPFFYETSVLLYNKNYMEEIAIKALEEADALEAADTVEEDIVATPESVSENVVTRTPEEQAKIDAKIQELIPTTMDDILNIANNYDAPEAVEAVLKWDVSDIFYNYFVVGNYMILGGEAGDDINTMDIYNLDTINCLKIYQNLNQFFSIDSKSVTYDSVLQDFSQGKIVFSVVTTDAIAKLEEAKENGNCAFDYGIATMPAMSDTLKSKSLSVTNTVVINGYSEQKEAANLFAKYLTYDNADTLYDQSGKVSSKLNISYKNPKVADLMEEYKQSISIPKMLETSNYWVPLEICFTKIWNGEDVNEQLKLLSEQVMTQVTGKEYVEEYIEEPAVETTEETTECSDEGMSN